MPSPVTIKIQPTKSLVSIVLAASAGAIGYSGHDGWEWCLILIFFIECV
jgi:hypothetical protein